MLDVAAAAEAAALSVAGQPPNKEGKKKSSIMDDKAKDITVESATRDVLMSAAKLIRAYDTMHTGSHLGSQGRSRFYFISTPAYRVDPSPTQLANIIEKQALSGPATGAALYTCCASCLLALSLFSSR